MKPHFLVQTHGRPPSKLRARQTRQEKFTGSAQHVRPIDVLKSFFNNEYGYSLGTFVHHYRNIIGHVKSTAAAQGMCVHYVQRVVHGGSGCVPRVSRSCPARRKRCACHLCMSLETFVSSSAHFVSCSASRSQPLPAQY